MQWVPPARAMARRALSGWQGKDASFLGDLRKAWADIHRPIAGAQLPNLGKVTYDRVSDCRAAGFCMCDERGNMLRAFVARWKVRLSAALAKGAPARSLFDTGVLLLRLLPSADLPAVIEDDGGGFWFHCSHANLSAGRFTLTALDASMESSRASVCLPRGLIPLEARCYGDPPTLALCSLWLAADDIDLTGRWYMHFYKLHQGQSVITYGEFSPGKQLLAEGVVGLDPGFVWGQLARRRRGSQGGRVQGALLGRGAPGEAAVEEGDDGMPPIQDGLVSDVDDPDGAEESLPDEVEELLREVDEFFDLEGTGLAHMQIDDWRPSEEDDDESSEGAAAAFGAHMPSSPEGAPAACPPLAEASASSGATTGDGAVSAMQGCLVLPPAASSSSVGPFPTPLPPPRLPATSAPAVAPESAQPAPRRGTGVGVSADGSRRPHDTYYVDVRGDGLCFLKHDARLQILSAHCRHPSHGNLCRVNRTLRTRGTKPAQGRPGGMLLAWLACAGDFPDQTSHHQAAAGGTQAGGAEPLSFATRSKWRAWAAQHAPAFSVFLAEHEAEGNTDGQEPEGLC